MATAAAPAIQESPEALTRMSEAIIGERNPRGIPAAVFVVRFSCDIAFSLCLSGALLDGVDLMNV